MQYVDLTLYRKFDLLSADEKIDILCQVICRNHGVSGHNFAIVNPRRWLWHFTGTYWECIHQDRVENVKAYNEGLGTECPHKRTRKR